MLGLGVVGTGVYRILTERADRLAARMDRPVYIARILVRNPNKPRQVTVPPGILTTDPRSVLDDPAIAVIIEALGGEYPAVDFLRRALENGKYVITANKEVMAKHGPELLRLAAQHGVDISFEASVGGGIPLIGAFRQDLAANRIVGVQAILNGTTNYILSRMADEGVDYPSALREAQRLGYAEPDPHNDVAGIDAAYKLAILSTLAFQTPVRPGDIYTEGIEHLAPRDIRSGQEMGYRLKLLCSAVETEQGVQARVHPALLPRQHPLAQVDGVYNAVLVKGDLVGDVLFYGRGAGSEPTGSAMVADLVALGQGIDTGTSPRLPVQLGDSRPGVPMSSLQTRYYLRMDVADRPGVLAQLAGVLGDAGISISSVIQKEANGATGSAQIVIMTHPAREGAMQQARADLIALPVVREIAGFVRVEQ
jgi:homoserine dehydrogenase